LEHTAAGFCFSPLIRRVKLRHAVRQLDLGYVGVGSGLRASLTSYGRGPLKPGRSGIHIKEESQ
jgi:hypothetical protein